MPDPGVAPVAQTLLGFDFGLRRIGVAIGNTITGAARPLGSLDDASNARRFAAIAAWIDEWRPDALIVGKPLNIEGHATEMTARAEKFGRQLAGRFGLPVKFCDERYSSAVAEAALKPGRENKASIDAAAAAVILQAWLDETRNADS